MSQSPTKETLESLYVINKHAGKYAQKAQKHYRADDHAPAQRNSARKQALYDLKARVLNNIMGEADQIERHRIDEQEYICLYFEGFSFHTFPDEVDIDASEVNGETKTLDDFQKSAEKEATDRTLKASLLHLQEEFGISANDLLPQRTVSYSWHESFNGWDYLEEGLMETPVWKQIMDEAFQKARKTEDERPQRSPKRPEDTEKPPRMRDDWRPSA